MLPSPQTGSVQSAGQFGSRAVSQVSGATTTPSPQAALTQETFVLRLFVHSPLLAVTVTVTSAPAVVQSSDGVLLVGGVMFPSGALVVHEYVTGLPDAETA